MLNPYKNGRLQKKNSFPHRLLLGIYNSSMRALMHFYKQYCLAPAVYRRSIIRQQCHLIDKKFRKEMPEFKLKNNSK